MLKPSELQLECHFGGAWEKQHGGQRAATSRVWHGVREMLWRLINPRAFLPVTGWVVMRRS